MSAPLDQRGSGGSTDEERRMVRAAGQVGWYTLLSRIAGLVRDVTIGGVFGVGPSTDAFFVAFRIPNVLRRLVGEGATSAAVVPVVREYLAHRSRQETDRMQRALLGVALVSLTLLVCGGVGIAPTLVELLAPGFDGATRALTVGLTEITFWYLPSIGLVALAAGVLHPLRHFGAPAFSPVLLNLVIIACILWLPVGPAAPIYRVAYGVVLGGVCQLAWQLPVLVRLKIPLLPRWQPSHPAVRRIGGLLVPVVFGSAIYQVGLLVSTLLASFLAEGSVSSLWYASRVVEFPLGVFVAALGTAALPSLAAQVQLRDLGAVRSGLSLGLRLINTVTVPAAVGLVVLAIPICNVLFLHGRFGGENLAITARVLSGFAIGLWAVSSTRLLSACLYALHDTRAPAWAGAVGFAVTVILTFMLMGEIAARPDATGLSLAFARASRSLHWLDLGPMGLALSSSLGAMVNLGLQARLVHRRLSGLQWVTWRSSFGASLIASLFMSIPLWVVAQAVDWLDPAESFSVRAATLASAILAGGSTYFGVMYVVRREVVQELAGVLPEPLLRFVPQFLQTAR